MIGILDYGMGNLRSVQKAFERLDGPEAIIVTEPDAVAGCEKLVLPGVGSFTDGMRLLRQREFIKPIKDFVSAGRPLLGVCLGMQLLFDASTEDAPAEDRPTPGLGLIAGTVVRFREDQGPGRPRLKVPHMGWNRLDFNPDHCRPLCADLGTEAYVYFVHSYHCIPDDPAVIAATADYGQPFCAAVHDHHLWATQFHPEKSQRAGLTILHNFATL